MSSSSFFSPDYDSVVNRRSPTPQSPDTTKPSKIQQTLGTQKRHGTNVQESNVAGRVIVAETSSHAAPSAAPGFAYTNFVIRFLRYALTCAVLITAIIIIQLKGLLPARSLVSEVPDKVWFTDKFRLSIPDSIEPSRITAWNNIPLEEKTVPLIAEFHTHTTHSDGSMSPAQVVDWAIAYGFNVLFVTDHNNLQGGLKAQEYALKNRSSEIHVVPGIEYTCCRIHMNLVGLTAAAAAAAADDDDDSKKPSYLSPPSKWPSDEELQMAINETHRRGGLVFVNHLPWSLSTEYGRQVPTIQIHPTIEQLLAWGVDGFESVSEGTLDLPTIRFTEKHSMPYITATDLHSPDIAPTAWTILNMPKNSMPHKRQQKSLTVQQKARIQHPFTTTPQELHPQDTYKHLLEDANNFTAAIMDLLRSRTPGATNFYYSPIGPSQRVYPVPNTSKWDWFSPLAALDFTYFWTEDKGMYSFVNGFCHERIFTFYFTRAFAFIFWAFLLFIIAELIGFAINMGLISK
ncbi:uncharacterized protein SAPINGB_P002172 [Magnusiomyces paraingens]|uniref:Polymerase/histidinol phosphatase N-terminal domain-containing protein n=1 Tax=Magnusiomyces paraingens TaxID=2606893 RepID=A0A5E8BES4_9ASCO|nr:uncharacterized protein SAPINGB_P002172 [Saprochaete ingens]VVT49240.1 unnamed protein product [Saprochaete ingens]